MKSTAIKPIFKKTNKSIFSKYISYSIILSRTVNGGIGINNNLPWKLPMDMRFFKEITSSNTESANENYIKEKYKQDFLSHIQIPIQTKSEKEYQQSQFKNIVIMGRKTYESIPSSYRPLKDRLNIVLSKNKDFVEMINKDKSGVLVFEEISECIDYLNKNHSQSEIFIIGGSEVYSHFFSSKELVNQINKIYLTNIITKDVKCDKYITIPFDRFINVFISKAYKENGLLFDFQVFVNKNSQQQLTSLMNFKAFEKIHLHEEYQYLNLIKKIILTGNTKSDRTRVGTKSIFGHTFRFDVSNSFPLLTTKEVFWKGVVEELLWFISGCTNVKPLQEKKVRIWDGNSTREYFDSIGLTNREEGDLGPVYGFQWRHFGAEYISMHEDYTNKGVDQLSEVVKSIKSNPDSRRIIICSWNAKDLKLMALPPCHVLCQFYVNEGKVSCQMYQRSCDIGLGVPFNIASYTLLLYMICHVTNTTPNEFIHVMGDAHIYNNHIPQLEEQIKRVPFAFPRLKINRKVDSIEDFTYKDFSLEDYIHHKKIKMEMAV